MRKVYKFRAKGIYLSSERYISFVQKVYTSQVKGIYVSHKRYIPFARMLRSECGTAPQIAIMESLFTLILRSGGGESLPEGIWREGCR